MKYLKTFPIPFILGGLMLFCLCLGLVGCTEGDNSSDKILEGTYYTVTFDSRGGSEVESQHILEGNLVMYPQTPTHSGYSFTGWFRQDNSEWNFDTDKVDSNITLYAGWQEKKELPETTPSDTKNLCEVYMTFGNETVTAQLYDNATSRDLVSRLPLTLEFSDYNHTEKIAYLPNGSFALDTSDAPETFTPTTGDLTVYIPWGNIAIFYNSFKASTGLAPFGKIGSEGIAKLSQISNHTQVTIAMDKPEPPKEDKTKVLIVYFSATNTTKRVAETIHSQIISSDIYEIVPAIPYTADDLKYYTNCRADREQSDPTARPEISSRVENMEQYNVIFIGYPIWHGQAPKIIYTFLESYDFNGVTIIPFCTSASSGMGNSARNLHSLAPSANWKSGARISGNNIDALIEQMS